MPQIAINGVTYHYRRQGKGPGLLLLHGFTGSSESWSAVAGALAESHDVVSIDLPGHGKTESPTLAGRFAIEPAARDIVTLAKTVGLERFSLLGYSMGGRLALYLIHCYPKFIRSLILESASPGIANAADREQRRRRDDELANEIERDGIPQFVDRWERLPLFASQSAVAYSKRAALRKQRLRNDPAGLANSLRGMGTGRQPSLWNDLPAITIRTYLLCGELDSKYVGIAREMARLMPGSTLEIVPGSGHNIHFERPSYFTTAVFNFLNQTGRLPDSTTIPDPD